MATATGSITMQYVPAELYKSAAEPATPADGDMWMDTANNILKRWDAASAAWVVVVDYDALSASLGTVQAVTTGSTDFLGLLASATYTVDGLLLTGIGGAFQLLLGPAKISFLQSGEEVAYITGNKLYITSAQILAEIQIGNYYLAGTADGGLVIK